MVLIPQGTRIIGEYSSDVGFGDRRVLLVWNRLIFPNGRSIVLERQPGADTQGYAGLEDGVDYHWWDLAKAAGLSTLLSSVPDDKPVKLTVELAPEVHRDLLAYAEIMARETGQATPEPTKLIPPMLKRFMATDRAFARLRKTRAQFD
mgnify:CR=1 FL=1